MISTPAHPLQADPDYPHLKEHVIGATGLAYYADKDGDFATHIAPRLEAKHLRSCRAYLALLLEPARGEAELDALIEALTIGETFFFRHQEMFDALREVAIPDLLARNCASRRLRIWSAGCSVGAEAYTMSMLLRREFARELAGWDVTIIGTDINREFLARAHKGCYEDWALRTMPQEKRKEYFVRSGKLWCVAPEYREGVSFQYHNLAAHPFPSFCNNLFAFDLILCRNVTIYFGDDIVRRVARQMYRSLAEGGWLSVGHAEPNTTIFAACRVVNTAGAVLYQKLAETDNAIAPKLIAHSPPAAKEETCRPWTQPVPPVRLDFHVAPTLRAAAPLKPKVKPVTDLASIRALADRGQWEEAGRTCQAAIAHDRLNPVVYFYLALVLEQSGGHVEAERALRQAVYLDRHFVLAHYYLGLLLQKQGHFGTAARSLENVLQLVGKMDPKGVFEEGDGITAGELAKLTRMQLETLEIA